LFRTIPKIIAIKLLSTIFDVVAAYAVYRIVSFVKQDRNWGIFAFFTVLLTPVVFIESSHWGQCDIIYTAFLLFMLDSQLRKKYIRGLIFFSIAFVFKFQAVFLAPILLYLLIKRRIPVSALLYSLGIYLLSILPAWLAGRPFFDLVKIYISQAGTYKLLSMNAPNIYYPWKNSSDFSQTTVWIGLAVAAMFTLGFLVVRLKKPFIEDNRIFLYDACLLSFFIPFLTPLMHERYFFPAALFLVLITFLDKRMLYQALLLQVSSVLSFFNFLYLIPADLTYPAFIINLLLAPILIFVYFKRLKELQFTRSDDLSLE
jgi:Gpi18-like mannosyltransferase